MTRYRMLIYMEDDQQIIKVLHVEDDGVYWSPLHWDPRQPPTLTELENAEEDSLSGWERTQRLLSKEVRLVDPLLGASEFHPRIARNDPGQSVPILRTRNWFADEFPDVWRSTNVALGHLASMTEELFRAIEPAQANAATYSHALRHLLILACNEVEAAWTGVLSANGYSGPRPENCWNTKDYVKLLRPMRLAEWTVALESYPEWRQRSPFDGWDPQNTTKSLEWYDAYNAVKHNRELNLERARFDHALDAVAAATIMALAQFGHDAELYAIPTLARFRVEASPVWEPSELYYGPAPRTSVAISL